MKKVRFWGLAAVMILLFMSACTQSAPDRPLVIIATDQPDTADPAENWSFGGAAYLPHIYDSLFRYEGEESPTLVPLLAAEIPTKENGGISQDELVYTIKLKPGASFHDGSPVNAEAVIYSYERTKAFNTGVNGITADWIRSMEKVDDLTVRFVLKQPFSDFLSSMGSVWGNYIVNPAVVRQHIDGDDWGSGWLMYHDAGSGPYTLTSYDETENEIKLARYAAYWGGFNNPRPIDQVVIRWLPDTSTARELLESSKADIVVNLPTADYAALENVAGFASQKHPSVMQYYLGLNGSVKPLSDRRVRQALQYSFDSERVIQEIFDGNLIKMNAAVGPVYPEVYPAKPDYHFDLEKAKQLLAEAGYDDGLRLTLNLMHFWPNDTEVAELWKADLAKIGIKLTLQETDQMHWTIAWFDECTASTAPKIGQISTMGVGGDYPSAWEVIAQVYPTPRLGGEPCSAVYINNPSVNKLSANIAGTTDPKEREQLFREYYDILAEDAGAIWIGEGVDLITMRDVVQGYQYYFSMGGNYVPLPQMSLAR